MASDISGEKVFPASSKQKERRGRFSTRGRQFPLWRGIFKCFEEAFFVAASALLTLRAVLMCSYMFISITFPKQGGEGGKLGRRRAHSGGKGGVGWIKWGKLCALLFGGGCE